MNDLKKKKGGIKSCKLIGISVVYSFRVDPDLGIEKIAIRIIPHACDGCLGQFNSV